MEAASLSLEFKVYRLELRGLQASGLAWGLGFRFQGLGVIPWSRRNSGHSRKV